MSKRLFTTDNVDDSYYMSSDLHVNTSIKKDALEFHIDGQRDNTYFTVYKQGVKDLHKFLGEWLNQNHD